MSKIVIALGGNALGIKPSEQINLTKQTAKDICKLIEANHEVIITHGNGPQVGLINLAFEEASKITNVPLMPFPECGAMSQGYIGYHLQNSLQNELAKLNINKKVATIITQVEVDKFDEAFLNPTKPIGSFYSKEESKLIEKQKGYVMKEDSNRGYRRVVPSPKPIGILELDTISTLINNNHVVITVGGGGIPVIKEDNIYTGVAAVIDKDLASAKLADLIDADIFIILTAVVKVAINFGKPNQINLDRLSIKEIDEYTKNGEFGKGSMLEKVQAAASFVAAKKNRKAIIASLSDVSKIFDENIGTTIY